VNERDWKYVNKIINCLGFDRIPPKLANKTRDEAMNWVSTRFFHFTFVPQDERYMSALPWRKGKVKSQIFKEALDDTFVDTLKEKTEEIKAAKRKDREKVGMFDFIDTPESEKAREELHALEKKPRYEGQHRDIVRMALKAGMPVPSRVLADYFDEPWASEEMIRRSKHLGMEYFRPEKSDIKSLPSADFPVLRDMLSRQHGKPMHLYVVFREHLPSSNATGARALHVCEVFLHADEARKYAERGQLADTDTRYVRTVALRFEKERLAIEYFDMTWIDLILLEQLLPYIESRLKDN
jgi:hypothetical protein